ncbi:MAG: hypothetical protein C4K58_06085 [Flavobacteriaceae bacterium]|nr:MAG: hypothetical protein C4K58_06085 [Flavobacteriaceae bacterium]
MAMKSISRDQNWGVISAVLSSFCWGTTGVFVKSLPLFSASEIIFGRCFVALLATLFWMIFLKESFDYKNKQVWVLGFFMFLYYFFAVFSYQLIGVAECALLLSTSPLFVMFYSLFTNQTLSRRKIAGSLVAFFGMVVVLYPGLIVSKDISGLYSLGVALGLLSSLAISLYSIYAQNLRKKKTPIPDLNQINLSTFLWSTGLMGIALLIISKDIEVSLFNSFSWGLLCMGIFATFLPTIFYGIASKNISSLTVTSIRLLIPVFASVMAFIWLHKSIGVYTVLGGFMVIFGLLYMNKKN